MCFYVLLQAFLCDVAECITVVIVLPDKLLQPWNLYSDEDTFLFANKYTGAVGVLGSL